MNRISLVVTALTLIFVTFHVAADEPPAVSREPLGKMQDLAMLSGDWSVTIYMSDDDGETWKAAGTEPVSISFAHKGFMLEEIPGDLTTPGFHMRTMITYDQYRDVYRKAALDDVWGIFDLYEGNVVENKLVLDNLKSGTFFPVDETTWRGFRLTIDLQAGDRKMLVESTDDNGETWQARFKMHYVAEPA